AKLDPVLDNANELDLYGGKDVYAAIKKTAATDKQAARAQYLTVMTNVNVDPPDRTGRLEGHRVYVCDLLKNLAAN
ncbi:MAG: hypothetical protein IH604_01800, partial [Burkholderiales bacterium]|nr:hypothetical protein [Burkholderiales bacterium]